MSKRLIKQIVCAVFLFLSWSSAPLAATAQYTYDPLNRLVMVQYDDGTTIHYAYDAVGNRTSKEVTAFSQLSLPGGEASPAGQDGAIPTDAPTLKNFRAPAGK